MKAGAFVWFFANGENNKKELKSGQFITRRQGKLVIKSGNRMYQRRNCEVAEITGKEKFLLTTFPK